MVLKELIKCFRLFSKKKFKNGSQLRKIQLLHEVTPFSRQGSMPKRKVGGIRAGELIFRNNVVSNINGHKCRQRSDCLQYIFKDEETADGKED